MPFRFPRVTVFGVSALLSSLSPGLTAAEKGYETEAPALSPALSHESLRSPADLAIDLLVAEPTIEQPVFLNFDARGRLWVVEYRQYPEPAGLKIVSRDRFWRNVYDRKPMPPGHPDFVPGLDRITIHEDTDGDGSFDHTKTFVDGLSLATSCVSGDGGVWVLNPPYLLFYPDAEGNDVPDGPPVVHLDGFGIQDSHSVVNSLCWGPDGWLYGSQGSTVTSDIVVAGSDAPPVSRIGQLIWRYHPPTHRYEVFAEGGGNVWSCEFDAAGRLLAGTNDKFPAYYFRQGAYYRKNFGKHGALSNPHAYTYFNGINAPGHRRISNSVLVYEGGALPERYDGALLYLASLQGEVSAYRLSPEDLNLHGDKLDVLVDAGDRWFRPVYLEAGPDGALYVCDWYDQQINHYRNHEGHISKLDGRLFRIRAQGAEPLAPFDLTRASTAELVDLLAHRNRWWRETARLLLTWRPDRARVVPQLREMLMTEPGQLALEALWALHGCDALDTPTAVTATRHENPTVRQWAVRLLGDRGQLTADEFRALQNLAVDESHLDVLSQLAASARRLDAPTAYALWARLLGNAAIAASPQLESMIWWGLEPLYTASPDHFVRLALQIATSRSPHPPLELARFIMRRMASAGSQADLLRCAEILPQVHSDPVRRAMIQGFEDAYQGRAMTGLPRQLTSALVTGGFSPISLQLRLAPAATLPAALTRLSAPETDPATVLGILDVLGELKMPAAREELFRQAARPDPAIQLAALKALQLFEEPAVATRLITLTETGLLTGAPLEAAHTLLSNRRSWALLWLQHLDKSRPSASAVSPGVVDNLRRYDDAETSGLVSARFGPDARHSAADYAGEITRIASVLRPLGGDPERGRPLFQQRCAACHTLFDQGGELGPDLTSYQRDQTDALLLAIVQPHAEIRSGYEMVTVQTTDGRVLSGFQTRDDLDIVGVRIVGGGEVILDRTQIKSLEMQSRSLMPEGLLHGLTDPELRDLFSYLRSPQPLALE